MIHVSAAGSEMIACLRSTRDAVLERRQAAQSRRDEARRVSDRDAENAARAGMIICDSELRAIHQQIIEALPQSGLRFELHETYDGPGQDGETRNWEAPADSLHDRVRDWARGEGLAPSYANSIADRALGAAISEDQRTDVFSAVTMGEGTKDEYEIPSLALSVVSITDEPLVCGWKDWLHCRCGARVTQGAPQGENGDETCARHITCDRTREVVRSTLL